MKHTHYREGDIVLIRAPIVGSEYYPQVQIAGFERFLVESVDIVRIEKAHFKPGDKVLAEGLVGTLIAIHEDVGWVRPDKEGAQPWTVALSTLRRLAPEPEPEPEPEIKTAPDAPEIPPLLLTATVPNALIAAVADREVPF